MEHVVVIKCGGSTLTKLTSEFFEGIAAMKKKGRHPIIVHGGGPAINRALEEGEVETEFVDGLRKTTAEVLHAVETVLTGEVNSTLVTSLNKVGAPASGFSGAKHHLLKASPIDIEKLGLVGEVDKVNTEFLEEQLQQGIIPVIAPIAENDEHGRLNVNADTAASAVAQAAEAEELVFVTDVDGILKDGRLEEKLTSSVINQYMGSGVIYGGMIPKVKAALNSLTGNIQKVTIANGNGKNKKTDGTLKGTSIIKEKASAGS
ncbi:acetylglutamate kinase [Salibacterium aidingense]|uniref:acetylglutamate kinase n=1 Tax=Salibacterium aidingense TaxID=384933 RepID=UPI000417A811|nr:acetylglutamate kinase [Salibacterium aidingense]